MEQRFEDKLQEIYKLLTIEVNFRDFKCYEIKVIIELNNMYHTFTIIYKVDSSLTFEVNVHKICIMIDRKILKLVKGELDYVNN